MRHSLPRLLAVPALLLGAAAAAPAQAVKVDPELPSYKEEQAVSGALNAVGSDTLVNLMSSWGEAFKKLHPAVSVQVEGKGSATAPPALAEGTAQLGPMSRRMKPSEVDRFEARYGYKPTAVPVAVDGLAVYVHKDNALERLTLRQVDAIFSKTRRGGASRSINTWGDLGLEGPWAERPISLYGRNAASGTYAYFKKQALFKGDYKDAVKEQPGSAAVVQGVGNDPAGIGYSGIGYRTSEVKAVDLARSDEGPWYSTDPGDVLAGRYPLSRFLYIYVNKAPNKPLTPPVRELLRFVLSREGQEIVVKMGFLPLPASMASKSEEIL